jgi:hypothetical protein
MMPPHVPTERQEPDSRSVPVDVRQLVLERNLEQLNTSSAEYSGDVSSVFTVLIAYLRERE